MGREPTEPTTPDLFSTDEVRDAPSATIDRSATAPAADTFPQRHILPMNLRHAVKQLSDGELDELIEVVFDEGERRGRLRGRIGGDSTPSTRRPSEQLPKRAGTTKSIRQRHVNITEAPLTRGQMNVVRSAFKAGITPSRIARQFGISPSNVRKALASDESRR
jgi:DNA-binding CsgD family transcriptional regulator